MTGLTIGITTALPDCKRGLAVNLAASRARDAGRGERVCVVDADPLTLDVTTRFAVRGPQLEDFAESVAPRVADLAAVHEPSLWVLPSAGGGVGVTQRAMEHALPQLRNAFDVVICDLAGGVAGPTRVAGRLDHLDWLLLAVTPDVEPVEAGARFLDHLADVQRQGDVSESLRVGIVITGDESLGNHSGSTTLRPGVIGNSLGVPVVGSVPQLWGRAAPNLGFGAALGIAELDDAVSELFGLLGNRSAHEMGLEVAGNTPASRAS